MEKIKSRLDAFADGIMAVIITIMVLNIAPVLHDSWANYLVLGKHIGIFLISFIFVANIWYQHATVFAEIETITYRIVIFDLIFLAFLALMPLFTNMMTANTTRITVLAYGGVQFLVNMMFRYLSRIIVHLQYDDKDAMQKVYQKNLWQCELVVGRFSHLGPSCRLVLSKSRLGVLLGLPDFDFLFKCSSAPRNVRRGNLA
ncbi:TMEM175 family protein [Lacticaseibacillus manihotivorans]|uniref:TMEM175 family protein n=1 Tax=Lacticaseibacillus manihotivorans TaxID=88233 RepID=UPI0006CFEBA0|nr:TMEM175 family protein [Lacticaseibacillus manihotivorans]